MRKIIHIDMDCFFAAVEMRDNPSLSDVPMAVGGRPNSRGVLCTANYAARKFGVRSAMSSARAMKLCPELTILPVRSKAYKEESEHVFNIFKDYTDIIQPISLDEAFIDVSECTHFRGSATRIAEEIRWRIYQDRKLTASAGVAPNKFLAKIASDWQKPNGLFVITPDQVAEFIINLPIRKIWGVGRKTAEKMERLGIFTCKDLQAWEQQKLIQKFGRFGQELFKLCRGIDDRPVQTNRTRKSFSQERTFNEDFHQGKCPEILAMIYEQTMEKLSQFLEKNPEYSIKATFVKIKFSDFQTTTIEKTGLSPSLEACLELLAEGLGRHQAAVRLLGVGVKFNDPKQVKYIQLDFLDRLKF
ncbi:MAG: DNA polymerase IV [Lentisphaeria bacterium]|nr:DNA polymerase IV [Lentisphaeria bacterium]